MPLCLRILPVRRLRRALQRRLSAQILLLLLWWKLLLQILRFSAQILLLLLFQISCCTRA